MEVIMRQKINGSWIYTEDLNILLELSVDGLKTIEQVKNGTSDLKLELNTLITLMIILWLEEKNSSIKQSWQLIHKKAVRFIEQNSNLSYDNFK